MLKFGEIGALQNSGNLLKIRRDWSLPFREIEVPRPSEVLSCIILSAESADSLSLKVLKLPPFWSVFQAWYYSRIGARGDIIQNLFMTLYSIYIFSDLLQWKLYLLFIIVQCRSILSMQLWVATFYKQQILTLEALKFDSSPHRLI